MKAAYDKGCDHALEKFALRRGEKIIRDMWEDVPQPRTGLVNRMFAALGVKDPRGQDDLNRHRQMVMAKAQEMDRKSGHTAFKPLARGGTQLIPRGAGEYGGGMEGIATPIIAAGGAGQDGGIMVRKHYYPEAEASGLAMPNILGGKRRIWEKNIPELAKHYGIGKDSRGGSIDFLENVPGRVDLLGAHATRLFGEHLNARLPSDQRMHDLHHENVLVLPDGTRKVVDFIPHILDDGKRLLRPPWKNSTEREEIRARQQAENKPIDHARKLDSPAAAAAKKLRGGYAEDPYARIERLKAQRAEFQRQQATPEARQKMREMNRAKAQAVINAGANKAAPVAAAPMGLARLKNLFNRDKQINGPPARTPQNAEKLLRTRPAQVPEFINPPNIAQRAIEGLRKRLPKRG